MIVNDLQRLRWQILDACLRDTDVEYFMGDNRKGNETGNTRNLHVYVNEKLREVKRSYCCSKRILQNDIALFEKRGGHLEPRFRRGHKRILRYLNLEWKNPLLKDIPTLGATTSTEPLSITNLPTGDTCIEVLFQGEKLKLQTELTEEVRRLILGYGTAIEVVSPKSLRQEILSIATELTKLYAPKKEGQQHKAKKGEQLDMFGDLFS